MTRSFSELVAALNVSSVSKDFDAGDVHISDAGGQKKPKRKPKPGQAPSGKTNMPDTDKAFSKASVVKVDEELGLVFGFAIICKRDGKDYWDLQEDHIPEDAMLKASADFMINSRVAGDMHDTVGGTVVFAFPLTSEIAKSLNIETQDTGLLIAMKPDADMLAKFKDGTYTGFSLGGFRGEDEEVA